MTFMAPMDAAFLASEAREHPMHVGGLLLFEQPAGAGPDFVGDLYRHLLTYDQVRLAFRRRPATTGPLVATRWHVDDDVDLEYHLRLSALPRPGRIRELLTLVSRLHGALLDRHRPLWEFHLIEGLADGRFAIYYKVHHALVDGINATRQMMEMFSADPAEPSRAPLWSQRHTTRPEAGPNVRPDAQLSTLPIASAARSLPTVIGKAGEVLALAPSVARLLATGLRDRDTTLPFQAPRTLLNVKLSGARRYAAQSWPYPRMRAVGKRHGATLNDVLLAMCAGALRRYLLDAGELPSHSLVAAVPVALPVKRGNEGGNAVTMVLCRLATDVEDPGERLHQVRASMQAAKDAMSGRSALQISLLGLATGAGPTAVNTLPGFAGNARPPYNLVISNVPGPRAQLYWNGAPAVGWYPVSLPSEGLALNITVISYADNIEFGLIGCRRSIPHLQRLLDHLEASLSELEDSSPTMTSTSRSRT